jgi:hypothetical protein
VQATGYKIATWPDGAGNAEHDKTVYTFHLDKVPFWEALDRICEVCGLVLQPNWGDENLRLFYQDSYVPFSSYNGPFKIVATGFNYTRNNNFGQLPRNPGQPGQSNYESLVFNLSIAVEPKIPIMRVGMIKLIAAEDDERHSMLPLGNDTNNFAWGQRFYGGGYYRNYVHHTQANLLWPSKTSRTVKTLKGVIPVTLLADQKPTTVTDNILGSKGKKFKAGPAVFKIDDVTEVPGKQYQVKMTVTEENKENPSDPSQFQSLQQRLELQDDKGNKYPFYFNMVNWSGPSGGQFTFTTQSPAPKVGKPAKLVYYAWILMEHEVGFEFKDLPLP